MRPLLALAGGIDLVIECAGRIAAWATWPLLVLAFLVVVLRYVFNIGLIGIQEAYVWINSAVFMLGASWCLNHDRHIRIDIVRARMGARGRALVELIGALVFLAPAFAVLLWFAWPQVVQSWRIGEISPSSGGLPFVYLHKSILIVAAVLMLLAGLSQAIHAAARLAGREAR